MSAQEGDLPIIQIASKIRFQFLSGTSGGDEPVGKPLSTYFWEMDKASDTLLIGYPDLLRWGYALRTDKNGFPWVDFHHLGISLRAEGPDKRA